MQQAILESLGANKSFAENALLDFKPAPGKVLNFHARRGVRERTSFRGSRNVYNDGMWGIVRKATLVACVFALGAGFARAEESGKLVLSAERDLYGFHAQQALVYGADTVTFVRNSNFLCKPTAVVLLGEFHAALSPARETERDFLGEAAARLPKAAVEEKSTENLSPHATRLFIGETDVSTRKDDARTVSRILSDACDSTDRRSRRSVKAVKVKGRNTLAITSLHGGWRRPRESADLQRRALPAEEQDALGMPRHELRAGWSRRWSHEGDERDGAALGVAVLVLLLSTLAQAKDDLWFDAPVYWDCPQTGNTGDVPVKKTLKIRFDEKNGAIDAHEVKVFLDEIGQAHPNYDFFECAYRMAETARRWVDEACGDNEGPDDHWCKAGHDKIARDAMTGLEAVVAEYGKRAREHNAIPPFEPGQWGRGDLLSRRLAKPTCTVTVGAS